MGVAWARRQSRLQKASRQQFWEPVEYRTSTGQRLSIAGRFDDAFVLIEELGEVAMETRKPVLKVSLEDFKACPGSPGRGERLRVRGRDYEVYSSQEDDRGDSLLILRRV